MTRHPDCADECQVAAARGHTMACNGVCAVKDAEDSREPSNECVDCGSDGECLPGCPSRLP